MLRNGAQPAFQGFLESGYALFNAEFEQRVANSFLQAGLLLWSHGARAITQVLVKHGFVKGHQPFIQPLDRLDISPDSLLLRHGPFHLFKNATPLTRVGTVAAYGFPQLPQVALQMPALVGDVVGGASAEPPDTELQS